MRGQHRREEILGAKNAKHHSDHPHVTHKRYHLMVFISNPKAGALVSAELTELFNTMNSVSKQDGNRY